MLKLLDFYNKGKYYFKKNISMFFLLIISMTIVVFPLFGNFCNLRFNLFYRNITDFFYDFKYDVFVDFKVVLIEYLSLLVLFFNLFFIYSILMKKFCTIYPIRKTNFIQTSINVIAMMGIYKLTMKVLVDILCILKFRGIYDIYSRLFFIEKDSSYFFRTVVNNSIYCVPLLLIIPLFIKMISNPYRSYYEVIVSNNVYVKPTRQLLKKTFAFILFLPIYTILTSIIINVINSKFSIIIDSDLIVVLSIFPYVTSIICYVYYLIDDLFIKI